MTLQSHSQAFLPEKWKYMYTQKPVHKWAYRSIHNPKFYKQPIFFQQMNTVG